MIDSSVGPSQPDLRKKMPRNTLGQLHVLNVWQVRLGLCVKKILLIEIVIHQLQPNV